MSRRKPTPIERESLYLRAREIAHDANGDWGESRQWLANIPWLHKQSVDGITAKVAERMGAVYGKPTPPQQTQENPA
jgi:hypothetical protein